MFLVNCRVGCFFSFFPGDSGAICFLYLNSAMSKEKFLKHSKQFHSPILLLLCLFKTDSLVIYFSKGFNITEIFLYHLQTKTSMKDGFVFSLKGSIVFLQNSNFINFGAIAKHLFIWLQVQLKAEVFLSFILLTTPKCHTHKMHEKHKFHSKHIPQTLYYMPDSFLCLLDWAFLLES